MNYKFSQFKTGQKFTCRIEGESVEGKIYVNYESEVDDDAYDTGVFLCQNDFDGSSPPDTLGYDNAWHLCDINQDFEDGHNDVTELIIHNLDKPKPKKELMKVKITLGTDPEFCIIGKENQIIGANEIFKPKNDPMTAELGYDGHHQTAEIRIKPAKTPAEATKFIKAILEKSKKLYPQVYQNSMIAQHSDISLGGHLHFGHPMLKESYRDSGLYIDKLVSNLDILLAFPALYLEDTELAKERRLNFGYGKLSDWRNQSWGIEYRALSSFIASKELTEDIFYLGHAIADATLFHNFEMKPLTEDDEVFKFACNHVSKTLLKPQLSKVFTQQRKLPLYLKDKKYKNAIEDFIKLVKAGTPAFSEEMKKGWNIDFNMADYLKVERIETLLEKVADILVAIHTTEKKFNKNEFIFVEGSEKDTACSEIADSVNLALNHLIDENVLASKKWQMIRVVGLSEKRGNSIWCGKLGLHGKRSKQLLASAWQVAGLFTHSTKIKEVKFTKELKPLTIGFGKAIREENMLVSEAIVVIASLLVNRELYKQEEKIRGKNIKLYVTEQKLTKPLMIHFQSVKEVKVKPIVNTLPKLNNVKLPYIIKTSLSKSEICGLIGHLPKLKRLEIRKALQPVRKEIIKTLLTDDNLNGFQRQYNDNTPLKKLSGPAVAFQVAYFFELMPSIDDGLENAIQQSRHIYRCGNCQRYTSGLSFCRNCDKCIDHCDCSQKPKLEARRKELLAELKNPLKQKRQKEFSSQG